MKVIDGEPVFEQRIHLARDSERVWLASRLAICTDFRGALSQDPVAKLTFLAVRKLHEASEGGRGVEGLGQCLDEGEELLFVQQQKFGDGHSVHPLVAFPPDERHVTTGWRVPSTCRRCGEEWGWTGRMVDGVEAPLKWRFLEWIFVLGSLKLAVT